MSEEEYAAAYRELAAVPALPPRIAHLVALAVSASVTHLHAPGVREHTRGALEHGATPAEIVETLQLTSVLGVHALTTGVPLLAEALRRRGEYPDGDDPRRAELKADFARRRGYWDSGWDDLLALDPDYFAAYTRLSSVPWESGPLPPKVKEFVYIAIDASATHMYAGGLRVHIDNALAHGATGAEIMAVLEIASLIGVRSVELGLPVLRELLGDPGESDEAG
ncbi:carboxymuconolactone decarboxylase family protein [Spongiactinospora sp. TRM90649]|uniref:carboxymuconolactone decarboxylase family protein n=1 Tax=Spongiactinospora sp. TRM90649 TaxID=3031114 RepID=UPI0023F8017B|nr:carboxymuconolactone decarboxylase family protein [Spongiactinospora sp. TRM90649]MDF5751658.1 carboxymuconolactone decarboxylase family protein [Spongiactinospora sp. TRM90649]